MTHEPIYTIGSRGTGVAQSLIVFGHDVQLLEHKLGCFAHAFGQGLGGTTNYGQGTCQLSYHTGQSAEGPTQGFKTAFAVGHLSGHATYGRCCTQDFFGVAFQSLVGTLGGAAQFGQSFRRHSAAVAQLIQGFGYCLQFFFIHF